MQPGSHALLSLIEDVIRAFVNALCKCSQGALHYPSCNPLPNWGRDVIRACVNAAEEPCVPLPNNQGLCKRSQGAFCAPP